MLGIALGDLRNDVVSTLRKRSDPHPFHGTGMGIVGELISIWKLVLEFGDDIEAHFTGPYPAFVADIP